MKLTMECIVASEVVESATLKVFRGEMGDNHPAVLQKGHLLLSEVGLDVN